MYTLEIIKAENNEIKKIKTLYESERIPSLVERVDIILSLIQTTYSFANCSELFQSEYVFVESVNNRYGFSMTWPELTIILGKYINSGMKTYLLSQMLLVEDWNNKGYFDHLTAQRILNQYK